FLFIEINNRLGHQVDTFGCIYGFLLAVYKDPYDQSGIGTYTLSGCSKMYRTYRTAYDLRLTGPGGSRNIELGALYCTYLSNHRINVYQRCGLHGKSYAERFIRVFFTLLAGGEQA